MDVEATAWLADSVLASNELAAGAELRISFEGVIFDDGADAGLQLRKVRTTWGRQAAAETRHLRLRCGGQTLPDILRNALRKEPFTIHRWE
jgi:hypothetical protein